MDFLGVALSAPPPFFSAQGLPGFTAFHGDLVWLHSTKLTKTQ